MELIECIRKSFINQSYIAPNRLIAYPGYISRKLDWIRTKEGWLFWAILSNSYDYLGRYDYILLIEIYKRFGKDGFKINQSGSFVRALYERCDSYAYTLDKNKKEILFQQIAELVK